jgi:tetratricopeptide (TPR) repeat protein
MTGETAPTVQSPLAQALEAVTAALRARDVPGAKSLSRQALSNRLEHPLFLNLRALEHEDAGRYEQALADLRRAHVLSPKDYAILNACGLCLARMGRPEEALQCYDQALELNPNFEPLWFNRGWVLEQLGEKRKSAESYLKTVSLNPAHVLAWATLAHLASKRGDVASTREYADKALALQPGEPTAILALADVELSDPPVAERRLRELLARTDIGDYDRAVALGQLGDVLNAADRPAEAFAAYEASNNLFLKEAKPRFEAPGQPTVAAAVAWMTPWAKAQRPQPRPPGPPIAMPASGHVFLMGFPRSGTTLLESMLTAHPDVVSLEERNTLQASIRTWLTDPATMSRLISARDAELAPYRDDYWACVKAFGSDPSGKIFIDKNPFNSLKLPLIYRLFPDAKVVFSIRDPRDVVFSCFRRRFNLNPSTYELLELTRAAALYDGMMSFAAAFRAAFSYDEHQLVYERLVVDTTAEAKAVCAFIGASWRDDLSDFAGRARRGDVASASSAQIARGLYTDGAGQWRRYRDQLAPVLDILAPWVERFGYPAD